MNSFNFKNINILRVWEYYFLFFTINAILFAFYTANPLPVADCWFFINTFIRKIVEHSLTIEDFFRVRSTSDHAQPLQKLLLLFHTEFFSLDFSFDTIISIITGLITVRWLVFLLIQHSENRTDKLMTTDYTQKLTTLLILLSIPFSILPFNVTVHYTWPLVGEFFITLPFTLWFYYSFCKFITENNNKISLLISTFSIVILLDTLGVITVFSALMYGCLVQLKQYSFKNYLDILKIILPAAIVGRMILNLLKPHLSTSTAISSEVIRGTGYLMNHLNEFALWFTIPASSPFMHREWIDSVLNQNETQNFIILLGSIILALHYWFWRTWNQNHGTLLSAFSALLMLYCYLSTVAILLFRLPDFGTNYLYSTRYVIFSYGLSVLALFIMLWQSLHLNQISVQNTRTKYIINSLLICYLSFQLIYIPYDWRNGSSVRKYHSNVTELILKLAATPESKPAGCEKYSTICTYDIKTRNDIISLLKNNKLSVFSQNFKLRHNLFN
jgi:hypothetical protein